MQGGMRQEVPAMSDKSMRPVAMTAQFTAKARAVESLRPDALFRDLWAQRFAGKAGDAWLARQPPEHPGVSVVIRTRFFDDFFAERLGNPFLRQVVLLAAGYDTRAYRLEWPLGTRLFEIDQPAVLAYKEEVLRAEGALPHCERIAIGADLESQWDEPLLAAGFTPDAPSIWLLEGLLIYLAPEEAKCVVATAVRLSSVGSWMGLDLINRAVLTSPWTRDRVERLAQRGMPWRFGVDDPAAWLGRLGWEARTATIAEIGRQYHRWPFPPPSSAIPAGVLPETYLVAAQRIEPAGD
jgi:methyltransferase (TIGR00027 family)